MNGLTETLDKDDMNYKHNYYIHHELYNIYKSNNKIIIFGTFVTIWNVIKKKNCAQTIQSFIIIIQKINKYLH